MGLIRQAESSTLVRDAIVLDLGDLQRQAEQIKDRTQQEAAKIISDARVERERLIAEARQVGLTLGHAQGLEAGLAEGRTQGIAQAAAERRKELDVLITGWTKALDEFVQERESVLAEARREVLTLACAMAERIVRRVISVDPAAVAVQIEKVLALVARPTRIVLRVNPRDEAAARDAMPALMARFPFAEHAEVCVDEALLPGSCRATTAGGGEIDASIRTQLDRLAEAIVPRAGA